MKVYLVKCELVYDNSPEVLEVFSKKELAEKWIDSFISDPLTMMCYSRDRRSYTIEEFNLIEE